VTAYELDHAIDTLARRQHGAFSRRQVLAAGGTPRMIERRVSNRRWLRLAPSVYALPSHPGTWHRAVMVAVLGEVDAVAGGRSAAVLQRVNGFRPGRPEIVVPSGAPAVSSIARVRRCSLVHRTVIDHIPVLDLCDTLYALSRSADQRKVEPAVDDLLASGRLRIDQLQRRHLEWIGSRRAGLELMRGIIDVRSVDGYEPPSSELERLLYEVLDRPGMPECVRQAAFPGAPVRRADAIIESCRLIIEADGRCWHARVAAFIEDRQRDRLALRHGYATLRFTYDELRHDPDGVFADILAVVAERSRVARPAA